MNRKTVQRALVLLAFVLFTAGAVSGEQRYARVTILHTNDTHSHLLPFNYPSVVVTDDGTIPLPFTRDVGGIARRATLVTQIRAQRDPGVMLVDAGDVIDGSPFSVEFAGEADFAAMNAAGYEVMVTGNHEYSNTVENFLRRRQEAKFPMLGANVFTTDGSNFLMPYTIKTADGLRVAILGLAVDNTYTAVKQAPLTIEDPIETAKEWVPKLRESADAVILLTHIGHDEDKRLAKAVEGIDAIIGGHSHTRVTKPVLVKTSPDQHAFWIGGTVVAQAFQWGSELGCVELIFRQGESGWTLMSYDGRLIPVTADIPEDPSVRKVVDHYHKQIAPKYDIVLCEAADDFLGEAAYNLVSDAMMESAKAEFAVQNYGGVRTDLPAGTITVGDIATMFPFDNTTITFKATGREIRDILLQRPAVAGIRYRIQGGELTYAEIAGVPLEDGRVYSGATHSFFAANSLPKDIEIHDTGINTREMVINYLKDKDSVSPDNERRACL